MRPSCPKAIARELVVPWSKARMAFMNWGAAGRAFGFAAMIR
jgi:hypothetical protein